MFVGLFVLSRIFLLWNLLKISLLDKGNIPSSSLLSSFIEESSVVCSSTYNAAILLASKYLDTLLLNRVTSIELGITELLIVRTTGTSLQGRTEAARLARLIIV